MSVCNTNLLNFNEHAIKCSLGENLYQSVIDMVKLLRVYGGCLGVERRRRTWQTAISSGQKSSIR